MRFTRRSPIIAVRIGPAAAAESYLSVDAIVGAARASRRAERCIPATGSSPRIRILPSACQEAGITFIGPPADVINSMGSKIAARRLAQSAGVPVVPGETPADQTDAAIADAVRRIGFPVLLKPSEGGGGIGMKTVRDEASLASAIAQARREAHGRVRRRHALRRAARRETAPHRVPDPGRSPRQRRSPLRARVLDSAPPPESDRGDAVHGADAGAAAANGRRGGRGRTRSRLPQRRHGGVPARGHRRLRAFYFLEMNTRLQVEHPVTEQVTGVDLVRAQIADGLRRAAAVVAGRAQSARARDRGARLRRGSGAERSAAGWPAAALSRAVDAGHSRRCRRHRRIRGQRALRPAARQADRVGRDRATPRDVARWRRCAAIRSSAFAPTSALLIELLEHPRFVAGSDRHRVPRCRRRRDSRAPERRDSGGRRSCRRRRARVR